MKTTIINLRKNYMLRHQRRPKFILIPSWVELELAALGRSEAGSPLVTRIHQLGVKQAFPKVLGLTPIWGAPFLAVF